MVERRPWLTVFSHLVLILGVASVALPVWLALTAATHDSSAFVSGVTPLWFGDKGLSVFTEVLTEGTSRELNITVAGMLWNSFLMAMGISIGKLAISILSAYAVVYFRFPGRMLAFWIIFMTLMLPVEVRIIPTFQVIADLNMLNSMSGLTIPLIASATATFFIPTVLYDRTGRDAGSGAYGWCRSVLNFFKDILLPLSRTNIAALFVITFIYGWNQYLWPILITTDDEYYTIVMSIQRMLSVGDGEVQWNRVMATTLMAMLPPVLVVLGMQKLFVKGLVETEK